MRVRFGGLVIELEKKGCLTVVILSSLLFALVIYTVHTAGNTLSRKLSRSELKESAKIVKSLEKALQIKDTNLDSNPIFHENKNEYEEEYENEKNLDAEKEINDQENDVIERPPVRGKNLRVKMAMETISQASRRKMQLAAKAMSAPHRPPDNHYNINVTLSDATSLDRQLPDTRPPVCATLKYDISSLPKVSIIIPFFNEAPTMLLRNIHSILNRSPDELLEEIILVDDLSYDAPLMEPLERFIANIPRISLIRMEQRSGLIVSRMRGARLAKAPAIIFLDAHSEVNEGWLEPLLDQLRKNPKQILQPFIDGVDNMNLEFSSPTIYFKGTFSWDLRYTWTKIADHEQERAVQTGEPFPTPTLVGCALAAMKDYFFDLGSFDEGMYVWGGENLELAFRAWMCGGKAVTVTCSRVGHVFKQSPNKFDGTKGSKEETVQKNLIRVADVWMDGMRKFFYGTTLMFESKRLKLSPQDLKTLRERTELRKRLKCHNFEWYLYNVFPEMLYLPPMDSKYFGEIMNLRSRACWEITEDYYVGMTYFCFEHKIIPKNNFAILKNGLMTYRDKCIKVNPPKPYLSLAECPKEDEIDKFGRWDVQNEGLNWGGIKVSMINNEGVTVYWCIVQVTNSMPQHSGEQMPQLGSCNPNDGFQMWSFTYAVDFTLVPEYLSLYQQDLYT